MCKDPTCQRLFNVYSHPFMTSIFELTVPSPQEIITNKNVRQHLKPGTTPQEIQEREHKSTFSGAFWDRRLLHDAIERAVEPCRNGEKTYAEFLVHKVHIKTDIDTWSFVFHQPHPPTTNPGAGFVGQIKFPGGEIYYQKQIIILFFKAKFTNMYPVGMLFDVSGSQVRMLNPTWNEAVLKQKHAKNQDPKMWQHTLFQTTKSHTNKQRQCEIDWSNNANQREEAKNTRRDHWIQAAEYWELEIERIQQGLKADEREKEEEEQTENYPQFWDKLGRGPTEGDGDSDQGKSTEEGTGFRPDYFTQGYTSNQSTGSYPTPYFQFNFSSTPGGTSTQLQHQQQLWNYQYPGYYSSPDRQRGTSWTTAPFTQSTACVGSQSGQQQRIFDKSIGGTTVAGTQSTGWNFETSPEDSSEKLHRTERDKDKQHNRRM